VKFTLEIELGNDAMRTYPDLRKALEYVRQTMVGTMGAAKLPMHVKGNDRPAPGEGTVILDLNGNTVGKWEVTDGRECAVCGVPAPEHGHWNINDSATHKWVAR